MKDGTGGRLRIAFLCFVVQFAMTACGMQKIDPVPVPITWEYAYEDHSVASIKLGENGKGRVSNLPIGFFGECDSSVRGSASPLRTEDLNRGSFWSGEVRWSEVSAGRLRMEASPGVGAVWSNASGFGGDITWSSVSIKVCTDEDRGPSSMQFFFFQEQGDAESFPVGGAP